MLKPRELAHVLVWCGRHLSGRMRVSEARALDGFIEETDVVLDVGAHSGNWTAELAKLAPRGRVLAFEALPYYAGVLRATMRLLRKTNVTVVGQPVMDRRTTVELVWQDPSGERLTGFTHVRGSNERAQSTIRVESVVLDEYLAGVDGRVRFIKMDIEGAELTALRGAKNILGVHRPTLYLEVNDAYCRRYGHSAADVFLFLAEFGYSGYLRREGSWTPVTAADYSGEGDVWFVQQDSPLTR